MMNALLWLARLGGIAGVVVTAVAFLARLAGLYWIAGVQSVTLFNGGTALMVFGCLAYVALLVERAPPRA